MPIKLLLCLLICFGFFAGDLPEAKAGPAYKRFVFSKPANQHWSEGIEIFLQTDVERCKKAYGDRWPSECEAPWPGKEGSRVEGITLTPNVNGVWRWNSTSSLQFKPTKHLAPNTSYTISLEQVPMSSRIQTAKRFVYVTPPQAVHLGKQTLWIDPSVKSKHVLSVPLTFIYPVNRDLVEKSITLSAPQGVLRLGEPQFAWNDRNDFVVVNVPVLQLPKKNTAVNFQVRGFQEWHYDNGNRVIQAANKAKVVSVATTITGADNLMDVREMQIRPIYDDNLNRSFELVVTTSLQTKPADLLEKLDLLLLPQKTKAHASRDCNWEAMPAISKDDIANSQKIKATLLQPAQEVATEIHLKLPVPAGRGILAAVKPGLKATSGLSLNQVRRFIKNVPALTPEINFLQPGNILPLHSGQKLDLHTLGVERLEWRVQSIRSPFLAFLAQKADFSNVEDIDFDTLSEAKTGTVNLKADLYTPNYTALDVSSLGSSKQEQSSLLYLELKGYVGKEQKCSANRLILISDIGLMLKSAANGTKHVFVRKLSTAQPVNNCAVMLLGANGMPVLSGTTNQDGRCDLPSTYGLNREKRPVAIVAKNGKDLAWLPIVDESTAVDYSDFDIQGRHATEQGLLASVYSQRGIYMPGETLHFGAIVTNQDFHADAKNLAITGVLYGPSGNELYREKVTPGPDGLTTFAYKIQEDCSTGNYRFDVALAVDKHHLSVLGSTQVRVEEFQPDTLALRIAYDGVKPQGWIKVEPKAVARIKVNLDNLYGEPARNHRIKAKLQTDASSLVFPQFNDYTFADVETKGEFQELDLPGAFTNEQGEAFLDLPLDKLALGTRRGMVLIEGFEKSGGRAVSRSMNVLFSAKPHVLGYKPEGEANTLNYLPEGSKSSLRLLLLDNMLKPTQLGDVQIKVSARRYVTSLVSDSQGLYRYDATPVDTELGSSTIALKPEGTVVNLDTNTAGDYLLTIVSANGEQLASIPYSVAGNKLAKPGEEPVLVNGTLALKLEKSTFAAGETVNFRISAPYAGTGLVTIERDTVLTHAWFNAKPGESVHSIKLPNNFAGRAYLNVSYVRSIDSPSIYMTPHCYAVAPITCDVQKHDMGLALQAPTRVHPGGEVQVQIKTQKPGRVQIFAVDEGVLQLTDYKLPKPLNDLLLDRALDVETRQAYHLLMPDHERLRGRIPGFGGGMGSAGGKFLNPFRRKAEPPFAYWSDILNVPASGTTVTFKVPNYFSGALRIMAVGSAVDSQKLVAASSAQAEAKVRGELIVKPELPLVVCPEDTFSAAVIIANTVEGSGPKAQVEVQLEMPKGLTLTSKQTTFVLDIPENAERAVNFDVHVGDLLGAHKLQFKAKLVAGGHDATRSQEISIRPPQHRLHTEHSVTLASLPKTPDGASYIDSNRVVYPYEAKSTLAVSAAPILTLRSIVQRLDEYPYGCTEQHVSKAMPYVVLWDQPKLRASVLRNAKRSATKQGELGENLIGEAIAAIRASLSYDGVSLWPGTGSSNLFMTAYAADFLMTMREHGAGCPEDLLDRLLQILEEKVAEQPDGVEDGRNKIYATWILQRDGRIMTSVLTSLEDWFTKNANNWEKDVLTSLLADSFATLRLTRRAEARLPRQDVIITTDPLFSTGMARALHALIVLRDFNEVRNAGPLVEGLQDAVLLPSASTVDLAMAARTLAFLASMKDVGDNLGVKLDCTSYQPEFFGPQTTGNVEGMTFVSAPGCKRYTIKASEDAQDLAVLLSEEGFERRPATAKSKGFEVEKQILNNQDMPAKQLELGDVVTCQICARSLGKDVPNVVILDLVPGGLEPIIEKEALEQGEGFLRYERREDRALFFVDLTPQERCYKYRLRATTKGQFVVPATQVEAMYLPDLNATSAGSSLTIR